GVVGGMLSATVLGVMLVPLFYVVVRRLLGDKSDGMEIPPPQLAPPAHDTPGSETRG
ncbi:MAG: hypothetical protein HIU89_17950, partial [Proteobacteria bacterium]|nr:hypothetical protein [Pseudomonadota bacterium]